MKRFALFLIILLLPLIVLPILSAPHELHVAGSIRFPARGIEAEVYTQAHGPDCGCASTLWHGGIVTTDADLSNVQVGDMAHLYTVEGEHFVLECVRIRKGLGWFEKPQGDVIIVNQKWVYRFTRL